MSWAKNALIEELKGLSIKAIIRRYSKSTPPCKHCGEYKMVTKEETLSLKDFLLKLNERDISSYLIESELYQENVLNLKINKDCLAEYYIHLKEAK